jgi:hypothetical protein
MKNILFAAFLSFITLTSFANENIKLKVNINIQNKDNSTVELIKNINVERLIPTVADFSYDGLKYQVTILLTSLAENQLSIDYVIRMPPPLLSINEFSTTNSNGEKQTIFLPLVLKDPLLAYDDNFNTSAFGSDGRKIFSYNKQSLLWESPSFNEISKKSDKPEQVRYEPISVYITATK